MVNRYFRILAEHHNGRVGVMHSYHKRDWIDWLRGYPESVSIRDFPNRCSIAMFSIHNVEEISEKEYFKEKLNGR